MVCVGRFDLKEQESYIEGGSTVVQDSSVPVSQSTVGIND